MAFAENSAASLTVVPLKGIVCEQYIRCGNAACRCQRGEKHGPYYYRIWREGDQVRKVYVKRADLAVVLAACEAHRVYSDQLHAARGERERVTRSLKKTMRTTTKLLKAATTYPNRNAPTPG